MLWRVTFETNIEAATPAEAAKLAMLDLAELPDHELQILVARVNTIGAGYVVVDDPYVIHVEDIRQLRQQEEEAGDIAFDDPGVWAEPEDLELKQNPVTGWMFTPEAPDDDQ